MILTVDLETYYDDKYSLSKMTNEEYINDPRFEVIGVSVKTNNQPAVWFSGSFNETRNWLQSFDWANGFGIAHNSLFDLAILAWKFDIHVGFMADTLSMSRAIHGIEVGGSLAKLVAHYRLGEKGTEVINAKGRHRLDFSPEQLQRYGAYCINDTELTYKLFHKLNRDFPVSELELIHLTLLMYTRPLLELDQELLKERLQKIQSDKTLMLEGLMEKLNCPDPESVRKKLCSNQQFADILTELGVPSPMKISSTTEKETFAFAKTDLGFIALEEHPDPFVQQLCSVRLGTKSTMEQSRIERFLGIAQRNGNKLPIPLKYCATLSIRWAGMDAINMQNLPSRDKDKITLKRSIRAPKGYYVVNVDSSQIEARWLAFLAGQNDLVSTFRNKGDPYSEFASKIYLKPISKKDIKERFVGKESILSLGYGTGYIKLRNQLEVKGGIVLSESETKKIVYLYRQINSRIPKLWEQGNHVLQQLANWPSDGESFYFGQHELVPITPYGIRLPNGMYIRYPGLRASWPGQYLYDSRKGPEAIWGGVVTANVVSALARVTIGEQLLKAAAQFPSLSLTVHDSGVFLIRKEELDDGMASLREIFSTSPSWAPEVPLSCEIKYGDTYGDC